MTAGEGPPVIILHRDTGRGPWTDFHEALSSHFTVYAPVLPGFDGSQRPDWMRTVSQLATMTGYLLEELRIDQCGAIGLGFGGWVAAEAAVQCRSRFSALILQSPMGLKPSRGEILDQMLYWQHDYVRFGFADSRRFIELYGEKPNTDQFNLWDVNREMTTRIAYKPYMFDLALPHLLPAITVPALIISCGSDHIVPESCSERYAECIATANLVRFPERGHYFDLEEPALLAQTAFDFLVKVSARHAAGS